MRKGTATGATVRTLLQRASERLRLCLADAPAHTADTPYLDALILLGHAMGLTREKLLASMPDAVSAPHESEFLALVERRCAGEPVAYLTGHREFYGREYAVRPGVLIPRPETELLVDTALECCDLIGEPARTLSQRTSADRIHVHDTCTGSGCVAITLALERNDLRVTASDASENALEIARENASALASDDALRFFSGDLLGALPLDEPPPAILTANPPYLSDTEYARLSDSGWREPAAALAAGEDGLDVVRRLVDQAARRLEPGAWILLETGSTQGSRTAALLEYSGFSSVEVRQDLAGHDRVVLGRR